MKYELYPILWIVFSVDYFPIGFNIVTYKQISEKTFNDSLLQKAIIGPGFSGRGELADNVVTISTCGHDPVYRQIKWHF